MKLVVGLGNPGKEYERTRHNTGFLVVEKLAREIQNPNGEIQNYSAQFKTNKKFESEILQIDQLLLVRPQTYMNKSGEAVARLLKFYKVGLENLWVVHDDLDIVLGEYKLQFGKGPRIHNGLQSVYHSVGSKDFWHVRVGVDSRQGERMMDGKDYVLQRFSKEEELIVGEIALHLAKKMVPILT